MTMAVNNDEQHKETTFNFAKIQTVIDTIDKSFELLVSLDLLC